MGALRNGRVRSGLAKGEAKFKKFFSSFGFSRENARWHPLDRQEKKLKKQHLLIYCIVLGLWTCRPRALRASAGVPARGTGRARRGAGRIGPIGRSAPP